MKLLKLTLAGDTNRLSPNQRLHWRAVYERKTAWKLNTVCAWQAAGSPYVGDRVRITFTLRRGRKLDPDNASGSQALKAIVDGLKGRAFPDDSAVHVEYGALVQEPAARYRIAPEVVIVVEALDSEGGTE